MSLLKPLIGVCCDTKMDGPHRYHLAGHKYVNAVVNAAGGTPIMLPSLADEIDWDRILNLVDGFLLTGSYSNIQPHLYGLNTDDSGSYSDELRDATTLPLIPKLIDKGIPLLAICRGFQEMNVVYGGTLHRMVHEVDGMNDHREPVTDDVNEQYAMSHAINIEKGGVLDKITNGSESQMVNSIHMQGVKTLGHGLKIEALAEDGLVEAFSVPNTKTFNLAVQWHPEWKTEENAFYQQIFTAFSNACNLRQKSKQQE